MRLHPGTGADACDTPQASPGPPGPLGASASQPQRLAALWPHVATQATSQPLPGAPLDFATSASTSHASTEASARATSSIAPTAKGGSTTGKGKAGAAGGVGAGGPRSCHRRQQEHALTFHSKIKSSGYGMTFPKARLGHAPPKPRAVEVHRGQGRGLLPAHWGSQEAYPCSGRPPDTMVHARKALVDSCTAVHVSLDGERVIAGSSTGQLAALGSDLTGCACLCRWFAVGSSVGMHSWIAVGTSAWFRSWIARAPE